MPAWARSRAGRIHFTASNEALRAAERKAQLDGRPGVFGPGAGAGRKGAAGEEPLFSTEPLFYHQSGGVVQHNPVIHVIFWGKAWNEAAPAKLREQLMAFYEGLSGSSWQGILTQYFDETGYISPNVTVSHPLIDERVQVPEGVTDGHATEPNTIEHEVADAIALQNAAAEANKEPKWVREANAQFIVIVAPGAKYKQGFIGGLCAYHTIDDSGSSYTWLPDADENSPVACPGEGETSRLAAHEYAESATDPYLNGWQTRVTSEIGDVCQKLNPVKVKLTTEDKLNGLWVQRLGDDHLESTCALADPHPPHVLGFTESASQVGLYEATLNASAYAENLEASYELKYGKTSAYEHSIPAGKTAAGVGFALQELHGPISGLEQGTTYHYRVVATNSNKETTQGADQTFTTKFLPPTVTKVEPSEGPENGGTSVTITGTYLKSVKTVKFGSSLAQSFVVNSETAITAVSPGGSGPVDVTVTNPGGTSPVSSADKFEYAPFPTVSGVQPDVGPQAAGSTVIITGTHLNTATAVKFGSVEAASFKATEGSLTAVTPPGSGVVDVTVTNPTGTSVISHVDRFAYEPASSSSARAVAWGDNVEGELGDGISSGPEQCIGPCSKVPAPVAGLGEVKAVSGELSGNGVKSGLALLGNGTVMSWGGNERGGLGDGSTESSLLPVSVSGLSEVSAISAGDRAAMALLKNGTVKAWGSNLYVGLGDGAGSDSYVPVSVCAVGEKAAPCSKSLSEVSAIAAGEVFSLALLKNGTVVAWGTNPEGQLGNGATTASTVPVPVSGLSEVSAIAAGSNFALALLKNGTVKAWGGNTSGQLGTGSTKGPEECSVKASLKACSRTPVPVSGLSEVSAIAAGSNFALALLKNGTVKAWGSNESGELGNGATEGSDLPVPVSALSEVSAISAGEGDGLALLKNGRVRAWGANESGQLGDKSSTGPEVCGSGTPCSKTPVPVSRLTGVSAISAGSSFELAIGISGP